MYLGGGRVVKRPTERVLEYRFNAFLVPSEEVVGEWVAHCLELDLVTQGTDRENALQMIVEAICLVALHSQEEGLFPPFELRTAPAEAWLECARAPIVGHIDIRIHYVLQDDSRPVVREVEMPTTSFALAG
jgi:predicted RNase H-like HicB family nuclease